MYIGVIQCVDVNNMLFRCFLCVQVNVLVKVMEQREKEKIMTRANKLMDKTVYAVSDKTASIMLTVFWFWTGGTVLQVFLCVCSTAKSC